MANRSKVDRITIIRDLNRVSTINLVSESVRSGIEQFDLFVIFLFLHHRHAIKFDVI